MGRCPQEVRRELLETFKETEETPAEHREHGPAWKEGNGDFLISFSRTIPSALGYNLNLITGQRVILVMNTHNSYFRTRAAVSTEHVVLIFDQYCVFGSRSDI